MAIRQLSQEEGISEATLHKWRAEARGGTGLRYHTAAGGCRAPAFWTSATSSAQAAGFGPVEGMAAKFIVGSLPTSPAAPVVHSRGGRE